MKLKNKLIKIKFKDKKNLFDECLKDFQSSKNLLISGGTTFDYFYSKSIKDKTFKKDKKIILFDERISSKKKRNSEKLNRNLVNNKIIIKKNFFNYMEINRISKNTLKNLEKRLISFQIPDTALIGVGDDGHIGSIFNKYKINSSKHFVLSKKEDETFTRISLNLDYIKKIKKIILVIAEKKKKNILNKIISDKNFNLPVIKLKKIVKKKIYLYYVKNYE